MKQKQPSTRKAPALSAEEELAELLADPTLKPSINFLGFGERGGRQVNDSKEQRPLTRPGTESVSHTDYQPSSRSVAGTDRGVTGSTLLNKDTEPSGQGRASAAPGAVLQPRKNRSVAGIDAPATESVPDLVSVAVIDSVSGTDLTTAAHQTSEHRSVPRIKPVEDASFRRGGMPSAKRQAVGRGKIRPAITAEDGHSLSEQYLYEALWNAAKPNGKEARTITLGFGAMSRLVKLTLNNCRLNVRSLIRKLAIAEADAARCDEQIGKTYYIYSPAEIVRRRKEAGFEWVIRSRGVAFVDPNTGIPLTDPVTPGWQRTW